MFQRLLRASAVLAAAALLPTQLSADTTFYTLVFGGVSATTATLESFTPSTFHSPTTIGALGVETWYGALAYDTANKTMYMVDGYGDDRTTTHSSLYSVNLTTGAATLIGSTGMTDVTGLTYDSANNTLYAASTSGAPLQKLNIVTGAATAVGSVGLGNINGLAYDSANNVLYGWAGSAIYSIDTGTGATALLSSSGLSSNNSGIVYDPTTNLLWNLDVAGKLTTISPSSYVQSSGASGLFSGGESTGMALIPPYACSNTTPPVISSVNSASSYGGYSYFASGSWLEIKGANLADPADPRLTAATNPGQWTAADFNGSYAPTLLDGIGVSINAKPAYVWYLSPGQLNVQAPEDSTLGSVAITVTNCKATSSVVMATRQALGPGLLAPASFVINGTQYMAATFASDGAYVLNSAASAALGLNGRPAKPGDLIIAYGVGFGDVTPSIPPGVVVQQSNAVVNPVTVAFGSANATLQYKGLAGNFVGLYEIYITVPPGLTNGDYQINVAQNGTAVPQTMYLTVHN